MKKGMNDYQNSKTNLFTVCLTQDVKEYTFNGVKYIVESKFQPANSKITFVDKIKKLITSDFTQLTDIQNSTIIESEYMCSGCKASKDAGKED